MTQPECETKQIAELQADNRRLRRLLDQRNAPGELRHRLQSTVAMMRAIVRNSTRTRRDLEEFAGQVEGRLDAIARAQAEADEFGAVPLHKLIADELLQFGLSEGAGFTLCGPDIYLQPRAGQVFALAIHELAVNTIEHGPLGNGGRITAEWSVAGRTEPPELTFTWSEQRGQAPEQSDHEGFGTEVLTRMVPYELEARAELLFEAETVRWVVAFSLPHRVGWVVES